MNWWSFNFWLNSLFTTIVQLNTCIITDRDCVGPATDWWPVKGLLCLHERQGRPYGSWDRLQHHYDLGKDQQKRTDGGIIIIETIHWFNSGSTFPLSQEDSWFLNPLIRSSLPPKTKREHSPVFGHWTIATDFKVPNLIADMSHLAASRSSVAGSHALIKPTEPHHPQNADGQVLPPI